MKLKNKKITADKSPNVVANLRFVHLKNQKFLGTLAWGCNEIFDFMQ